jgi:cytochrome c oxidase subunit II
MLLAVLMLLTSCESPSTLEPRGPRAGLVAGLWWWLLLWATVVAVVTFTFLGVALWRSRQDKPLDKTMGISGEKFALLAGAVFPAIVLLVITLVTLEVMAELDEPAGDNPSHVIEVIGWMWWWEVRYPGTDAVTANEIHIPAGETVEFRVSSADVIHSFWVPEIAGKVDMMPGGENIFWIRADEPGIYRGQCAEFCGLQHAFMAKLLIAHEPEEYQAWLERESQPAPEPVDPVLQRGQEVFMENQCHFCHAIRGTEAVGIVGPDLTHIMSRQTLGAVTIDNSIGNLAAWTADPHRFKPGVKMPPVHFAGEDFEALIAYLVSLE